MEECVVISEKEYFELRTARAILELLLLGKATVHKALCAKGLTADAPRDLTDKLLAKSTSKFEIAYDGGGMDYLFYRPAHRASTETYAYTSDDGLDWEKA